jgi:bifunctional non-homologous end joining protein LigD
VVGGGPLFRHEACKLALEGVISKRVDRPYAPGNRGLWVKSKCLNREEFVVVGWTDPEGGRKHIGALLLGYYTEDGRLLYAGRAGTGITAQAPGAGVGAAAGIAYAPCRATAARQPFRLTPSALPRELGAP